jgi:AcrR family transcriptional regulator
VSKRAGARATRAPLSRESVLAAAIELADERGIDALTMRRLGQQLGVEAMSLYNHVANKDDLLDGIANRVLSGVELPADGDWKTALRRHAVAEHELFRRHPWACGLALSPARNIPVRVERVEWMLGRLRGAGFSAELAYHGYHALESHTMGFTLWAQGHAITAEDVADLAPTFLREHPPEEYPHLNEHVQQHLAGFGREGPGAFELVLDLILDGLERLRDST